MRICYLVDARSPIARNWIEHFAQSGHEVHVISSYPGASPIEGVRSHEMVPLAFSDLIARRARRRPGDLLSGASGIIGPGREALTSRLAALRDGLSALDVYRHTTRIRHLVEAITPDLMHAMRIPFEGIAAAEALRRASVPLLLSVWGNDFTLHAGRNRLTAALTRRALARADAILPDARRDLGLARMLGFSASKPTLILPGGGGIQESIFHCGPPSFPWRRELAIPANAPVVLNSRGFRQYVRNDTFFRAIPLVLKQRSDAIFLCTAMQGSRAAEQWLERLDIAPAVRLLPFLDRSRLADLFRLADLTVSLTEHDGTPNTLLEAMACGAFPVTGDIDSIRDWIEHDRNGILCNPADPEDVARGILRALQDTDLRTKGTRMNLQLVRKHAEYGTVMPAATAFYGRVIDGCTAARRTRVSVAPSLSPQGVSGH